MCEDMDTTLYQKAHMLIMKFVSLLCIFLDAKIVKFRCKKHAKYAVVLFINSQICKFTIQMLI